MQKVADGFGTVADRAVYLPAADALVCADLHLGRAAASAVDVPLNECGDIVDRLIALTDRFQPGEVVLAGDVLHSFGYVPTEAETALDGLGTAVDDRGARLVVVVGNHDTRLAELVDEPPVDDFRLRDGTVVCHGHERPVQRGSRYVVGHDHPAIVIEGRRRPCYLYGPRAHGGADVLALPAFNPGIPGTAVNGWSDGDPLSPLLAGVSRFQPIVWDTRSDEALVFPMLDALRGYL